MESSLVGSPRDKGDNVYSWYLIYTKHNEECRAEERFRQQNIVVFRPKIRFYKIRQGSQIAVTQSLFPRYLFVYLDGERCNWVTIRSTRGVQTIVRFGEYPVKVGSEIMDQLTNRVDENGIVDITIEHKKLFQPGDVVEITDGCFRGNTALVESQIGLERVIVLLSMLGKQQQLSIPIKSVQKNSSHGLGNQA